jgi:hypothetical protein
MTGDHLYILLPILYFNWIRGYVDTWIRGYVDTWIRITNKKKIFPNPFTADQSFPIVPVISTHHEAYLKILLARDLGSLGPGTNTSIIYYLLLDK